MLVEFVAITMKIESVKTEIVPLLSFKRVDLELIICRAAKAKVCGEGFSTRIKDQGACRTF